MSERDFCLWLWGYMELSYTDSPTVDQWKCIKAHLATVFEKKAPSVEDIKEPIVKTPAVLSPSADMIKQAIEKYSEQKKIANRWPADPPIKITC